MATGSRANELQKGERVMADRFEDTAKFVMTPGQSFELDKALLRNDCDRAFVKWLSIGDNLGQVRAVYEGSSQIVPNPHNPIEAFLLDTFTHWYGKKDAKKAKICGKKIDLFELDFKALASGIDANKFGEYFLNEDMKDFDFSTLSEDKIKIVALPDFVGRPLYEVASHVVSTYSKTYKIPGIEFWRFVYMSRKVNETVRALTDDSNHFFFGSLVRDSGGHASVPCVSWRGSEWDRRARWLDGGWRSNFRVVLLEI